MDSGTDILIRKLKSRGRLTPEAEAELIRIPMRIEYLDSDQDAVRQGETPADCCLLIEGFMYRHYLLPDGRRQILAIHTPGDIPDLHSLHLSQMDHGLGALNPCTVAYLPHENMRKAIKARPELTDIFWRETLIDAAIFRQWIVSLGRRNAQQRLAHLICELFARLKAVGRVRNNECFLPLSQAEIADAVGLSSVHVNRTLQAMRADGLISFKGDTLSVPDWERLTAVPDFDPTYLQIVKMIAPQA